MYTDHEIIEGLKSRNEKIIKFFYTSNQGKAYSVLYRYGVDETECLSIYNDAIVSVIDNISRDKYKAKSTLTTYLVGIAKLICFKKLKNKDKHSIALSDELRNIKVEEDPYEFEDLEDSRMKKATLALTKLDEMCRQLLVRFYYEGASLSLLADDLGYSPKFIRVKKGRCLKKMKNLIR